MSYPVQPSKWLVPLAFLTTLLSLALTAPATSIALPPYNEPRTDADRSLAWVPAADFSHELDRLAPPGRPEFKAVLPEPGTTKELQSARVEQAELERLLRAPGLSGEAAGHATPSAKDRAAILNAYAKARALVGAQEGANPDHLRPPRTGGFDRFETLAFETLATTLDLDLPVPPGLPDEFAEHLRALADYFTGHLTAARDRWQRLLDRPEEGRRNRTVWAAFMIGKSWLDEETKPDQEDPNARAVEWFGKTRAFARAGFPDPLGLAAASLGWEAAAERRRGNERRAVDLYLQSHAAGDRAGAESLALMCHDWFANRETAEAWADAVKDPAIAGVVTAYAMAEGTRFLYRPGQPAVAAWLSTAHSSKTENALGPARLALIALQIGDKAGADNLLAAAPAEDPLALWLRGKRAASAGKLDRSADLLGRSAAAFRPEEIWLDVGGGAVRSRGALAVGARISAELGVVELARRNYTRSLDCLLRAGWFPDACYVAECVLTPEELIEYVSRNYPGNSPGSEARTSPPGSPSSRAPEQIAASAVIRDLLARRLVRLGRWKEAADYFDSIKQPLLATYVAAIRAGHDADRSDDDRADSFWKAAVLAREHGVELFGHDSAPGGGQSRSWPGYPYSLIGDRQLQRPQPGASLGPSADELHRLEVAAPHHYSRLDARFVASEHAWSAAALMPDESDETARRLCIAGNWITDENPQYANRFYRALVDRCGTTELGRKAVDLNGLPTSR